VTFGSDRSPRRFSPASASTKDDTYSLLRDVAVRIEVIGLLPFIGACGKSAQLGLHVWLPDAMEGPNAGVGADPCGDDGGRPGCS
jgi:NADH-quinone oxidoreductase subunit L